MILNKRKTAGDEKPRRFFFEKCSILDRLFRSNQLPVAPRGDFLCEQKVTKESHRERVFRLPLSL